MGTPSGDGEGEPGGRGRPPVAPVAAKAAGVALEPSADTAFVVASQDVLFATRSEVCCDACDAPLVDDANDAECDYRVNGEGAYMWTRGGAARFDKAPLCPECAAAIGMTALARWEIEEEEG